MKTMWSAEVILENNETWNEMRAEKRILENYETSQFVSFQIMNKTISRVKKKKKKKPTDFLCYQQMGVTIFLRLPLRNSPSNF